MRYEGSVYRPPSEAHSLIVQATIGCSHNQCTFCSMYLEKRFRMRSVSEIIADIRAGAESYPHWERVFLADGDALILPAPQLEEILDSIRTLLPNCNRVGIYGSPRSILLKTPDELTALKSKGLGIIYIGVESGSDTILSEIRKGATRADMKEACLKVKDSGIPLSVMLISGIGGTARSSEHALQSATLMESVSPDYLSLLTLMVERGTVLETQIQTGSFELLSSTEVLNETRLLLEHMPTTRSVFRCNHASNYLNLKGNLPEDRDRLLRQIDRAQQGGQLKSESYRRL